MPDEIKELADQLAQQADLGFNPATLIKGVITASNPTGTPPNVSLTLSGDTTTPIDLVRYIDSYSPVVGDTVLVGKQGLDIFVLGQMNDEGTGTANGWTAPTLSSGFTTGGNSNGNVEYRLVIDNGERKMQWRGSVAHTGTNTSIMTALATTFRPAARRSIVTARQWETGSAAVHLDFNTDGTVTLTGATVGGSGTVEIPDHAHTGLTDYRLDGYLSQAGSNLIHAHGIFTTSFSPIDVGGATTHPSWVSFNGIEYFL